MFITYLRFGISSFMLESSSPGLGTMIEAQQFTPYNMKEHMIALATLKNGVYPLTFQTIYPDFSLVASEADVKVLSEKLLKYLEHRDEHPLSAFSIGKKLDAISAYDWHQMMGHYSMKTIVDMAIGMVTRMVLKDVPGDLLKMDSCLSCTLATVQHLPFKTGHTSRTMPLELIHGDIVGPMPVESVSCCMYGFVLMDKYSHASWVLSLRVKSNVPAEFEVWARSAPIIMSLQVQMVTYPHCLAIEASGLDLQV